MGLGWPRRPSCSSWLRLVKVCKDPHSPLLRSELPWRYRLRIPPQTCPLFACQALQSFQFLVPWCVPSKPPAKSRPNDLMIEIAPVGQYHDGDWPTIAISGQDSQGDGFWGFRSNPNTIPA